MIRLAEKKDLDLIISILLEAKKRMYFNNIYQWLDNYPNIDVVKKNIENKVVYLIDEVATITLDVNKEEYLKPLEKYTTGNYLMIHRVAVKDNVIGKGYGYKLFNLAKDIARSKNKDSLVVDTHITNYIMQRLIDKNNFKYLGLVNIENSGQRIAFEYKV